MPPHGQQRWRKRMLGLISAAKRMVRIVGRSQQASSGDGKRESMTGKWEILRIDGREAASSTSSGPLSQQSSSTSSTCCSVAETRESFNPNGIVVSEPGQDHTWPMEKEVKCVTLNEIPFSVISHCAPCELPEDIEQLIFEMAARDSMTEALHTLVFVNRRIQKWVEYVIYESVILKDAKHARLFLNALEHKHPDFVAGAVKILALPTRISFNASLRILTICKNIRHLSWLPTNPVADEVVDLVANLPLISLRARVSSFVGHNPDFSAPLFDDLQMLFVTDHQDVWKKWTWEGLCKQRKLKWLAFNLDGRLDTSLGWVPVRTLEKTLIKPTGARNGVRLCICYGLNQQEIGDRWIHRSKDTFSAESMAVLSLDHRIDEPEWRKRINGERQDFQICEQLVAERQTEERRLDFMLNRMSV